MNKNFWLTFAVNETVVVLSTYVGVSSPLTPEQKAAAEKLIADGQAFLATLQQ